MGKQQPLPTRTTPTLPKNSQLPTTTTTTTAKNHKPTPQPAINRLLSSITFNQKQQQQPQPQLPSLSKHELDSLRRILCPPSNRTLIPASLSQQLCSSLVAEEADSFTYPPPNQQLPLRRRSLLLPRQSVQGNGTGPSADGYPRCTAVSNAILSCFPESQTILVQNTWSKFIWNNNYPTFIGSRNVDIYLYNANSETPVANWRNIPNDRGMIGIYADDSWFPPVTSWQDGRNLTYPYFFIITTAGAAITGGEQHQATFHVVQTAPPPAYVASSLASASYTSQLLASISSHTVPFPSPTPNSNLQPGPSGGDPFPKWEIALIVVLGTFALLIFLVAAYLAFTNARKRRQVRIWQAAALGGKSGSGGSVASHSPMIQNEGAALIGHQKARGGGGGVTSARDLHSPSSSRPGSPLSATQQATSTFAIPASGEHHHHHHASGASEALPTPDGPITSVDASMMADAFRKALRKPEFALPENVPTSDDARSSSSMHPDQQQRAKSALSTELPADHPEERSSTPSKPPLHARESMYAQVLSLHDSPDDDPDHPDADADEAREIMDRELASEGRSMTSVDNRKRPQVHG